MSKSRTDVVVQALQILGVVSSGEAAQPEQTEHASAVLDGVWGEMETSHNLVLGGSDWVEDAMFLPLSRLLATELASHYGLPAERRSSAVMRLRQAVIRPQVSTTVESNYF